MDFLNKHMARVAAAAAVHAMLMAAPIPAFALQPLQGEEGKKHVVRIPSREMTRIAIDGGRLASFRFRKDELEVQQDKDQGVVYVTPKVADKQISVFAISASGATHELILQPVDTLPLESILIKDAPPRRSGKSGEGSVVDKASSFEQSIKRLMLIMLRGERESPDAAFEAMDQPLALWNETSFRQVARFTTRTLVGDVFWLKNVSNQPMKLAEQEFYKLGVLAVAIDSTLLRPGESTPVFVIRGGAQ